MKTKKSIIFLGVLALLLGSCKDYLEPWPNGNIDNENIWEYQSTVQGIINRCYDNIGTGNKCYDDNESAYLDGVTDNAVITSTTHALRRLAVNSLTTSGDPLATYWDRNYRSISQCNIFLKDRRGINTRYNVRAVYNDQIRTRLQGEAYALRAYFMWDLLQKFGGRGVDGTMLGVPIITDVVDPYGEINYARNTYEECVNQIIRDCDSALYYLPTAYRDFLYPSGTDMAYLGSRYWNRFDDTGVWAIKANVYLTWASPRYNPANDIARWDSAAKYSKKLVDFKLFVDQISSGSSFRPLNRVDWFNPNNPEIVFSTRYRTGQTYMERMFYPGGFQGNGQLGATQDLVDAFGMSNGYPKDHASGAPLYNATNNPYLNRDPRFYSVIFYNGRKADRLNNAANPMYTFENWNVGVTAPGKDAAGTRSDNSRTNYHIKKFVYMDVNWADASVKNAPHAKYIYRWAHFVLAYAEAANHVTGDPNTAYNYAGCPYAALTPKAALKHMRARATYDNATPSYRVADPYLDEVATAGHDAFDALVKNERRIETCFEGMRFYDLRRWTTGDKPGEGNWEAVINQPVHGAYITETAPDTYTYDLNWEVEERALPSPYNPIPYYEILRMNKLVQNEGWPTWE